MVTLQESVALHQAAGTACDRLLRVKHELVNVIVLPTVLCVRPNIRCPGLSGFL